jgi:hypothetical protein
MHRIMSTEPIPQSDKPSVKESAADTKPTMSEQAEQELQNILQKAADDNPKQQRVEMEREETFDEPSPTSDPSIYDQPALADLGEIEVSEQEVEQFLESVLHDQPFALDIEVLGKHRVRIRSRSTYENQLCFKLVREEAEKQGGIDGGFDYILWLQRYSVALGLVELFDKPFSSLSFKPVSEGDMYIFPEEHKEQLNKFVREHIVPLSFIRWQTILRAYVLFTAKEKKLLENVANQDFWNPAG